MQAWSHKHWSLIVKICCITILSALVLLLAWGLSNANLVATMCAGGGLALAIVLAGSAVIIPDNLRSQATERTLRLASQTLDLVSEGLNGSIGTKVCQLLLPETQAKAIAISDTAVTLACVGESSIGSKVGEPISEITKKVIETKRMQTFNRLQKAETSTKDLPEDAQAADLLAIVVISPLVVSDNAVGTLKFYYRHARDIDRTQLAIVRGFSELLSTQLSTYELDRQADLTARAELKALQAQINPHFLFNTLNTIASFTRTDSTKARNLLREFSAFYRGTLQISQNLIPLSMELEQTRRYLVIEKARFGEKRIKESEEIEKGCESLKIPGFLIQPIVENSVRHAMRDEGVLHIDIQVVRDGSDVMIAIADDGLGMDEEVAKRLADASAQIEANKREFSRKTSASAQNKSGAGIALSNVAERIERFFGVGSGVEILSKPGEGTVVTLHLANAALQNNQN